MIAATMSAKPGLFHPYEHVSRASCVPNCSAKIRGSKNSQRCINDDAFALGILVPVQSRWTRLLPLIDVHPKVE